MAIQAAGKVSAVQHLDDWFVGHVSFPITSYLMNRKDVLVNYRKMIRAEYEPEEAVREMQRGKLLRILRHAYEYCPFHRQRFRAAGLVPEDIRTLEDFRRIPPLSRQEVIEWCNELVDSRYHDSIDVAGRSTRGPGQPIPLGRFRRHKLVRNTSSGSTGAPVIFYEDGSTTAGNWAFELRLRHWYGYEPGVREARMARVSADYVPNGAMNWIRKTLWHQLMLPGVNLADKDYALALQKIREFRPQVLWGFTSALAGLADYIRRSGEDVRSCRPKLAIGWAAPVYEHEANILREVFHCAVTNIYGAREVGHIAGLCPCHTWHINQENVLVECNENDPGAEPGEILVTPLNISPMPFIRYRLGDLGRPASSDCACGRKLQVLKDFLGRTGEVFVTKDGRMIAPNFWCRFFMVDGQSKFVERFQVIYRRDDLVTIRIVKKDGFSPATEADMTRILKKNFTPDIHFQFEYVPRIDPQISGKYQMVVNESKR
jgi:phenylacetate-CoA ligase